MCRQEAEEHDRAMNALEAALDDTRSHARSKEQKLLVTIKELKASRKHFSAIAHNCGSLSMLGSGEPGYRRSVVFHPDMIARAQLKCAFSFPSHA